MSEAKSEESSAEGATLNALLGLNQTIYEHGGSRIWREINGVRDLLADTYGDEKLAIAVMECIRAYLSPNDKVQRPSVSEVALEPPVGQDGDGT